MRRAILGVFFLVAACGGDARKSDAVDQSPGAVDQRADRARYVMSSDGQALISSYARFHSQDALDTCVNAWIGESDVGQIAGDPVRKPNGVLLRLFLSECLDGATPGDARSDSAQSVRADRDGSVNPGARADRTASVRSAYTY